ncbi:MAG: heme ABC transporter ATP-binding protein [Fusobacteriota bacterium]
MSEIKIKNLDFAYKKEKVLKNINLSIKNGEITSIIGPNGSGKTTLLKLMLDLLTFKRGDIKISDKSIKKYSKKELSQKISYVSQQVNFNFDFTVYDIVMMGRYPYVSRFSKETNRDKKIVKEAMETTYTWKFRQKSINELSGGELQRVIIARSIVQNSEIMMLDEPISHLDIHHQMEIMDTLKKINAKKNTTVITVLHNINLAVQYSDKIILLDKGKIIANGDPREVISYENIKKVYKMNFMIIDHPKNGLPYIIPVKEEYT